MHCFLKWLRPFIGGLNIGADFHAKSRSVAASRYRQQFGRGCREEKKKHIVHSISCVAVYKLYFLTPSNVGLVKTQDAGCNVKNKTVYNKFLSF